MSKLKWVFAVISTYTDTDANRPIGKGTNPIMTNRSRLLCFRKKAIGADMDEVMKRLQLRARDNGRLPIPVSFLTTNPAPSSTDCSRNPVGLFPTQWWFLDGETMGQDGY